MANLVNAVFFANIPNNKSKEALIEEFKRIWPDVFADNVNFTVNLYQGMNSSRQRITKVVVTGVVTNIEEMSEIARRHKIFGHNIVLKKDNGEPRNSDGSFAQPKRVIDCRRDSERQGITQKKISTVFKTDFLNSIGYFTCRLVDRDVFVKPSIISRELLFDAGDHKIVTGNCNDSSLQLKYSSVIGAMQSVSLLNGKIIDDCRVQFRSQDNITLVNCDRQKGLGRKGILKYDSVIKQVGYIPFEEFDTIILDESRIQRNIMSLCWRCGSKFLILGIEKDLNWLAGKCRCVYKRCNDFSPFNAFKWTTDSGFTRLVAEGRKEGFQQVDAVSILHEPMKQNYSSSIEYARLVLPILEEEWNFSVTVFQEAFECSGRIISSKFIERSLLKDSKKDLFAMQVVIERNPLWEIKGKEAVKQLSMKMVVSQNGKEIMEEYTGRLFNILSMGSEELVLYISMIFPIYIMPSTKQLNVTVIPQADSSEYKTTSQIINKWAKTGIETTVDIHVDHLFLSTIVAEKKIDWYLPTTNFYSDTDFTRIEKLINSTLNENQLQAKDKALTQSMSYIQGPPGTGKTQVAAAIIISLSIRDSGLIVVTAASNEACNCLAERIWSMSQQLGITPSVVRIMSSSKEDWKATSITTSNDSFSRLEDLVKMHPDYYKPSLEAAFDLINDGRENEMIQEDRSALKKHINSIQKEIILQHKIVVSTLGSLADLRLAEISKDVSSLIIEEAGQLTQPQSLLILLVKPERVIMIGDHLQLPPTIKSPSAQRAGLGDSPLLIASNNYNRLNNEPMALTPGWTTLTEQHRMIKPIRELVSDLTYRGLLTDAPAIRTREPEILHEHLSFFPELQDHSIVLIDEQGLETKIGTSYKNTHEAIRVAQTVTKLLKGQTSPHKITVLSFYEAQKQELCNKIKIEEMEHPEIKGYGDIRVCNVDAFQGRENAIIILSFVRSNNNGDIGFANVPNRINVGLSRARVRLVIVCNLKLFGNFQSQVWKTFNRKIKSLATIIS